MELSAHFFLDEKGQLSAHDIAAAVFDDCCHIACDFIKTCFERVPMEAELARTAWCSPSVWIVLFYNSC
jgi:hypothetical protein